MSSSRAARGVALALLGGICWGFSGACGQFLFNDYGVDPLWLSAVRMLSGGVLLLAVCLCRAPWRASLKGALTSSKDLGRLALFAIAGLMACQVCYLFAIKYSNAGTATVLQYVGPVLIVVFVCLKGARLPRLREVAAIICVLAGTFLLATHGNPATMVLSPEGLTWGLLAALTVALYTLLPVGLMDRWGAIPVTSASLMIGGVCMAVIARPWVNPPALDGTGILAVAMMVVFGTVLAFAFYLQSVTDIGAAKASLIASVETVSATAFAVLWLGTVFTAMDLIGFVFIMATVFILMERRKSPADQAAETSAALAAEQAVEPEA